MPIEIAENQARPAPRFAAVIWPLAAMVVLAATPAAAQQSDAVRTENVHARLLSATTHATPGTELEVALHLTIREGWHTYWKNPGDSGEATRIGWKLPPNVTAGPIAWPAPERVPFGPLVNFGYRGDVLHRVAVTVPTDWPSTQPLVLEAEAFWLVCEEICIPESGQFRLELPVGKAAPSAHAALFEAHAQRLPRPSPWPARFSRSGNALTLELAVSAGEGTHIRQATFFADSWGHVAPSAAQSLATSDRSITLEFEAGEDPPTESMSGVLVLVEDSGGQRLTTSLSLTAEATAGTTVTSTTGLGVALGLALLGGLLLNLMPCVFPVLSLKAMQIASTGGDPTTARRQGLAYTAGVLVFFLALGMLLLALRSGGSAVGWGFQLQWPPFVAVMAYLMFGLALVMLGVVEPGGTWTSAGDSLTRRHGWTGSFFTGALAALVATPCTAPFMGTALGAALTQPAPIALAIMLALGAGLSLPFLALGFAPSIARLMPRPGPWMARLRGLLAFPLLATSVWLLWVLARQVDDNTLALVMMGLLALGFAAWLWREAHMVGRIAGAALRAGALALIVAALAPLADLDPAVTSGPSVAGDHEAYSPERLAELRAAGTPVLVNLTAAWCIACKVNEQVVLSTQPVRVALDEYGVVYLLGDWTNRNRDITALLDVHDRAGVPLYLVYPAGGAPPRILPQILTRQIVLDALADAARPAITLQTRLEKSQ